jgi:dolichyl-phosphate beta-glucosyltransferase
MTLPSRSLIIPMKDEASRLAPTIRALHAAGFGTGGTELVLVDDGSTDGTADLAEQLLGAHALSGRVVRLPRNIGKGGAIQAGVAVARGDAVAFVDADLSSPPDAIEAAFELVESGKADVVVTTRVHPEAVIPTPPPFGRRYAGKSFNVLIRSLGLTELSDTQCGLKAYTAEAARTLYADLRSKRFAFDVEVIARAEQAGLTLLELPIEWSHVEASRVRPLRDGARMALDVVWLRWVLRTPSRARSERGSPGAMDDERFEVMARLERDHWWFAAKRRLVRRAIADQLPMREGAVADVGCGTGAMVDDLAADGFAPVVGTDASTTAIGFAAAAARAAAPTSDHLVTVAEALPFRTGSLRCLTSLDVVEHLDDDVVALREYRRVLAPGGVVVLTVPAYQWAWSDHDVALGHRRRYTARALADAAEAAGLSVERVTYFHAFLVLPALLLRRTPLGRVLGGSSPEEASFLSPSLNRLIGGWCRIEGALARRFGLPAGLSVLLVARR